MASKTIELRKDIQALLSRIADNVFYRRCDKENMYPHIVYSIEDIFGAKVLNIDIWDKDSSTVRIENLADSIEKIKDEIITNENHTAIFYYNDDRKWIDDDDKAIQRISMSFEINYYGKER